MRFSTLILALFVLSLSPGCATTSGRSYKVETQVYTDPSRDISKYHNIFLFRSTSGENNPLIEKAILCDIKSELLNKGYNVTENGQESDALVFINFSNPREEKYIPPQQYYIPQTSYGTASMNVPKQSYGPYTVVGASQTVTAQTTQTVFVPQMTPGETVIYYSPQIGIFFHDSKEMLKNALGNNKSNSELFWSGHGIKVAMTPNILDSSKEIISKILSSYPDCVPQLINQTSK